jgi:fatty acid desaturase
MHQVPLSTYATALFPELPRAVFAPRPWRVAWLALHAAVAAGAITVIALGWGGLALAAPLALVIGHSFACMAFVGHETLHGSTVRRRRLRHLVGWLAFAPFMISPRLWTVWHNQVHHGNAGNPEVDPDAYPSLARYRRSRRIRVFDRLALGIGHPAGVFSLLVGLTVQSLHSLFSIGGQRRYMTRRAQALAIGETLAAAAGWATLGVVALGPLRFLFAYVIPLIVANVVVMAYILTNHSLSPYTEINDPLLSSLTVTTPRLLQVLHLGFGYHVEHHLFPKMSPAEAPRVRALLLERWPERYQSMPLATALWRLARTPRIHLTAEILVEPRSGRRWPALLPRDAAAPARRSA